jgi:hypothetical protein
LAELERKGTMLKTRCTLAALAVVALCAGTLRADLTESLKKGTPDVKSIGALAFAADGVLFLGDAKGGAIFAIDTADTKPAGTDAVKIEGIDGKIASSLGIEAKQLRINDLAVNPASGNLYLSVAAGMGADAKPALIRVDRKGKIEEVMLKDVKFARAEIPGAAKQAKDAITGLAFVKDRVFIAGLSSEEFASSLRAIPFPFKDTDKGVSVEIYHGSHGRFETNSPVRTFVPYDIKGETYLLAGYTCTPLVKLPVAQLKAGEKVKGTTIAELGNMNVPLDMITYTKDGKDYILMANNKRGVMKIATTGIDTADSIKDRVSGTAGLTYDTIKDLKDVVQLAKLDDKRAVILTQSDKGVDLQTIDLP